MYRFRTAYRWGRAALAIGLFLLASLTRADDTPVEWLPALLQETLLSHPSMRVGQGEWQAAQEELAAARWGRFPTLSLDSQTRDDDLLTTVRVEQPLWTGGRITGQIDNTQAQSDVAEASLAQTALELMQQTTDAFFEVVRLSQRLQAAEENETQLGRLLELIQRRVAAEVNPDIDQILAQSRLHQATQERLSLERQRAVAYSQLEQLVSRPVGALQAPPTLSLGEMTREGAQQMALAYSPMRAQLFAAQAQSQAQVTLARAESLPRLVVGHEYQAGEIDPGESRDRTYLAVQMSLGAGLSSRAVIRAANARQEAAQARIRSHEQELRQRVQTLWAEVDALTRLEHPARDTLASSEALVEAYLRLFRVGKRSWLDVLNAQRERAQAAYSLADIEAPLQRARLTLLLLSGQVRRDHLEPLYHER